MTTKTANQAKSSELTEEAAEKVRGGIIAAPPDPNCIGCLKHDGPKRGEGGITPLIGSGKGS